MLPFFRGKHWLFSVCSACQTFLPPINHVSGQTNSSFIGYSTYIHPLYGLCHWSFILFAIFLFLSIFNLIRAFRCISPSMEIIFLPLNVSPHTCFCHYVLFRLPLLQYCQTRTIDSSLFLHCGFSLNSHRCNSAETAIEHFKVLGSIFFHKPVLVFM